MLYTSKIFGLRRLLNASNSDAMSFTEFELWNYICHQVGISDIALHTFVGTRIIPWAKSKPFDYFLRKDEELKKE